MKDIRQIVAEMPPADRRQMLEDWEIFDREGQIGDCVLRRYTEQWLSSIALGYEHSSMARHMKEFAFEGYRFVAHAVDKMRMQLVAEQAARRRAEHRR